MRVLVIGTGSIGERHVRCFQQTGRSTVTICETDPETRHRVRTEYGLEETFESLEEALSHPLDAAVICTPSHLHIPMAIGLTEAGVHSLIEKPVSTGLDGIEQLMDSAKSTQTQIMIAYVYRAHPMLARMREAILEGRFGKPVQVVAVCGQHFPFYRPAYRQTYYTSRSTGGGAIQDALTHVVNAAEWLVGPITEVTADSAHKILAGVDVEDTAHVIARHGEVLGSYSLNQYQAPNEIVITVVCEEGTARFEMHRNRWRWMSRPESEWKDENVSLERDTLFVRQANCFLDTVRREKPPLCGLREGLQTLLVNLAILRATETREWVTVATESVKTSVSSRQSTDSEFPEGLPETRPT